MDILSKIIATKRGRVAAAKSTKSADLLRAEATHARSEAKPHALFAALNQTDRPNVIAEFKRRSPSKGVIRADADPVTIACAYECGGAAGISILTEEDYFDGSLADLRAVRGAVSLPLLRKDFIFDEYQVYEAAAVGADALLLIVAALEDNALLRLRQITEDELGMDALVEVHTGAEMKRALKCGAKLVGVNNRNLRTFNVSLETSIELARAVPPDVMLISESGLNTRADLVRLRAHGYRGFLIGETLMRADRPELALRDFIGKRDTAAKVVLRTLYDSRRARRVDLYERSDGSFGFEELHWLEDERSWAVAGRYSESFTPSLEAAEFEARQRVSWLVVDNLPS